MDGGVRDRRAEAGCRGGDDTMIESELSGLDIDGRLGAGDECGQRRFDAERIRYRNLRLTPRYTSTGKAAIHLLSTGSCSFFVI